MLKAAVVGVNRIGQKHCYYLQQNPDVELVAICDLNQELLRSVGQKLNVKTYSLLKEMLVNEALDLAIIATGGEEKGSHHYEPAMAVIEAGKDVLIEKPLSNRIEEAVELVNYAAQQNVRLACNLNHRFVPAAWQAKKWIENGELGTLLYLNMKLTIDNKNESSPWVHMRALHSHSIDVLQYLGGNIKRVQSFMTKGPGRNSWSTASINLEFESGAVGHLTGSYDMDNHHPIEYCEAAGHKGRLTIDNVYEELTLFPHSSKESRSIRNSVLTGMNGFDDTFKNRIDVFISEIKQSVSPSKISGSGLEALSAQQVIEAAICSQEENGAVIDVKRTSISVLHN
ncbi:Gfo/Idh/MocA family protein [Fictibacillus fluitans]|uniref:Gfo/Idh/MocA family oxidoreductase n=1 Tax=Fictibacillus fluitans TaxID=3058422 RepID=A0ABT8HQE1_9BACL|nr:Gfo/Idh/MocA family oxidoreductase [Fictibacillus sp. NE201]MDN4522979.1 Gfo/Idh/MocA family oxidoreductase [Fictibacillus sp. NE201]